MVVVKCHTLVSESPNAYLESPPLNREATSPPIDDSDLKPGNGYRHEDASSGESRLPIQTLSNPPSVSAPQDQELIDDIRLILSSEEKPPLDLNVQPLVDALKSMGIDVSVSGNVQYEITKESVLIQGKNLSFSTGEGEEEFRLHGVEGKIELRRGKELEFLYFQFTGNVTCYLSGQEIAAEKVVYRRRNREQSMSELELIGAARWNTQEVELHADRMVFGINHNKAVILEGHARLIKKHEQGAPTHIQAERIEWNPVTDLIKASDLNAVSTVENKISGKIAPMINDGRALTDAIARDPELIGVGGATEQPDKRLPTERERR